MAEPEVVARHAEAAGRIDDAITYYHRAGERAQARSAHGEAIGQFREPSRSLARGPGAANGTAREVALQLALGASLVAARGFAHAETEAAYERARALAEGGGDAARLAWHADRPVGPLHQSRRDRARTRARRRGARAGRGARRRGAGAVRTHTGRGRRALPGAVRVVARACERALALYDPERHHRLVRVRRGSGRGGTDLRRGNLWLLGRPDAALSRARAGGRAGAASSIIRSAWRTRSSSDCVVHGCGATSARSASGRPR